MGVLVYGGQKAIEFDDRLLAHLEIVIVSKLRRHEGFLLSWKDDAGPDSGRVAIWLDPAIPLVFNYEQIPGEINRAWLESLIAASNSTRGIIVSEEPASRPARAAGANISVLERDLLHG